MIADQPGPVVVRLAPAATEILEGLYQHRLLSIVQIHALFVPTSTVRWAQKLVRRLQRAELVAAVRLPGGRKLVYLTPAGVDVVEAAPRTEPRRKVLLAAQAEGPLQRHTLAVNDVGIAFVQAARARGDEFGPLSWRHEIAHPIGAPPGRRRVEQLIADAVLTYQQLEDGGGIEFHYRFLELDRATMPVDLLAEKLARYARLYHHTVAAESGKAGVRFWETRYPIFPGVLLVLQGQSRDRLVRRQRTVLALCAQHPGLQATPQVQISSCLSADLTDSGPFAPIWRTVSDPGHAVDWLGRPTSEDRGTSR